VITALHDTLNSKLTIVRLFTSVTNPYICLALCFEPFLNLRGKIEKTLYYTCFCKTAYKRYDLSYYKSYDTSVRLSYQQSSGCFASTRAGEIVQILVCHPAFYEEHDTSEEDCCLTCGLINIRQ
jgi:hypothetical protein